MRWIVPVLMIVLLGAAPGALAYSEQDLAREAHQRGEIMSLGDIMRNVKKQVDGRIISTHFQPGRGSQAHVYTFEVLSDNGDLMRVHVNASTSAVMRVQRQKGRGGPPPTAYQGPVQQVQGIPNQRQQRLNPQGHVNNLPPQDQR